MSVQSDAVIIGSGINGLVAAALLSRIGWRVTVLERNSEPGGLIATEELTVPGYRHDTFSCWHGMFLAGPAWPLLAGDLVARGVRYSAATGAVSATVRSDGTAALLYRDQRETAETLSVHDGSAYLAELKRIGALTEPLGRIMTANGPVGALGAALASRVFRIGQRGLLQLARDAVSSLHAWAHRTFDEPDVETLLAPWLLHAGMTPDSAGGCWTALLMAAGLHHHGAPVLEGGSSLLVAALCDLISEHGGRIVTATEATEIRPVGRGVNDVIAGGMVVRATRAVLASTSPAALYLGLLAGLPAVDPATREQAARYRPGRAAMQIHVALKGPMRWRDNRLNDVPIVHLCDGGASVRLACAQAEAGMLPAQPTIVVGQPYVLDPTRVPDGCGLLWIQLQELPRVPATDAGGEIDGLGAWDQQIAERYADRVISLISVHAPDVSELTVARAVLSPADLQQRDVNLVGGDPYGGSGELDQALLFRPFPQVHAHRTPVLGVWHIGASTHPGPGLSGASGYAVAARLAGGRGRLASRAGEVSGGP